MKSQQNSLKLKILNVPNVMQLTERISYHIPQWENIIDIYRRCKKDLFNVFFRTHSATEAATEQNVLLPQPQGSSLPHQRFFLFHGGGQTSFLSSNSSIVDQQ